MFDSSSTVRTAVYGPVCTVVWEGRGREASPYPDAQVACRCTRAGKLTPRKSTPGACESSLSETQIRRVAPREAVADPLAHGRLILFAG